MPQALEYPLSANKLRYVLFHLQQSLEYPAELDEHFIFHPQGQPLPQHGQPGVIFPLAQAPYRPGQHARVQDIPVLFPGENTDRFYSLHENNLVFHHDLLSSAFYLLSGYQEYKQGNPDFSYTDSLQYQLGAAHVPLVNYYFELIIQGLEAFCRVHGYRIKRRRMSNSFVFLLTHDVDAINAYGYRETRFRARQFLGLEKRHDSKWMSFLIMMRYIFYFLTKPIGRNPYWTFPFLHGVASRSNLAGTYYLLEKTQRYNREARYRFTDRKILRLMRKLHRKHYEIGLHAAKNTAVDFNGLLRTFNHLQNVYPIEISGVRHYKLQHLTPQTPAYQEKVGLKYDISLGFSTQAGFRNSYALPFLLYDFENDRPFRIWQFPLLVVDHALLKDEKLDFDQSLEQVKALVHEVRKFHGVFTLLWHNSFFDEHRYPGIRGFYKNLVATIAAFNPDSLTGSGLLFRIQNLFGRPGFQDGSKK